MTKLQLRSGKLLYVSGQLSTTDDCCCVDCPCGSCNGTTYDATCATGDPICGYDLTISGFPSLVYVETSSIPGSYAGEQWYDCTVLNQTVTITALGSPSITFLGTVTRIRRKLIFAQLCNATPNTCDTGSGYCCEGDYDFYLYYDGNCGFSVFAECAGVSPSAPGNYLAWVEDCLGSGTSNVCTSLGRKWTNRILNACGTFTIEEPSTDWFISGCGTPSDDPADPGLAVTIDIYKKALTTCV